MAKFLDTQAISNELMKLIKEAKEKIILVSPYLSVNTQIQERLKTKGKLGTLAEIVIVYGKSDLKKSELTWIKDIEDLKVYEKGNLHAKCYINENKAIICSMNLYDYSQQNNIEMGILITKEQDKDAYEELFDEINNIKVNGNRIFFDKPLDQTQSTTTVEKIPIPKFETLSPERRLKFMLLKQWRLAKSRKEKSSAFLILTDGEIMSLVSMDKPDTTYVYSILPKKKAIQYCDEILSELSNSKYYTVGRVTNLSYQTDAYSYDRVRLQISLNNEEKWFDTTQELPNKERLVAVKINKNWFNEYFYLD